ncbi:MAG: D-tyrosyl-tRNA(Tyr) deacylase [Ichthyobacteriaceae bacterium]|nr:D-tyrosyl-tRNA(Tyr) deacylase [Ichthyobacteriaceae bacterium]
MRALIQRVTEASVAVNNEIIGSVKSGFLILLGIEDSDSIDDIKWLSAKISKLRIFNDENEVMNKSILDVDGNALVVSQFTLHSSTKKGNRPSYIRASKPDYAIPMYDKFVNQLEIDLGKKVQTGKFGADMKVALVNDGPVTIWIDTKEKY